MMRSFTVALFLLFSYTGFSDLVVDWVNDNTIVVSGYGDGNYPSVVITNLVGVCSNCTAIAPSELDSSLSSLEVLANDIFYLADNCYFLADFQIGEIQNALDDLATFRRFGSYPSSSRPSSTVVYDLTNYVFSVVNMQTQLDRQYFAPFSNQGNIQQNLAYNNGIYDYANQYVYNVLNSNLSDLRSIHSDSLDARNKASNLGSQLRDLMDQVEPCTNVTDYVGVGSGGSGGSGSTTNVFHCAWTEEQARAVLDYLRHIDDDQHRRFNQLSSISNFVFNIDKQLDSYSKLVSGVLYNDGTIVVDDGDNSWTNVYRRGFSDLYDYDKSNILQRIELLLFGLSSSSSSTNWGDVGAIATGVSSASSIEDSDIQSVNDSVSDQLDGIGDHFEAMFDALNFFGSGSLSNFSLNDPSTVFGIYEFEVESNGVDGLSGFRSLCRTCFQIFYWCGGIAFLVFFWYFVISTVVRHILFFIRFFNNLLT